MRVRQLVGAGLVLAGLMGSAQAQDNTVFFDPQVAPVMVAPSAFDGLYAGVLFGPISARKSNFNTQGAEIRGEVGGLVGWNQPIAPGVIVGGELQATLATDLNTTYLRAMALARVGFLTGGNTLVYVLGGVGHVGEGWAFEGGIGAETMVTDTIGLRLEAAGIGQLGPVPNGNNIPAISAMRITGGVVWQLDGPPASPSFAVAPATDFAGTYAGINIGGLTDPNFNFFDDYGNGFHLSRFEMGGFAGITYAPTDLVRAGVEGQLAVNYDTSGDIGLDVLALGRLGIVPTTGVMAYAAGGLGLVEGQGAYAFGGGVEYALWGDASLRGEALLLGRLDGQPGLTGVSGPTTSKVTIGTVWHFN